eukprot:TRINITY_DN3687_c0_g4_i2.p1 TRINITY_DN3687_c0_g4~~TRINITY_DN3687_c0_g4_i2.p1  ORF type:complete len:267 (-),score=53.99 TRINITY_DN3687_c0_g4_i2:508-1269(-)
MASVKAPKKRKSPRIKREGAGSGVSDDGASADSSSDYHSEDYSWIPWFCGLKGNEFFCEVEPEFVQDGFNLTGLNALVPYYDFALDMILDIEPTEEVLSDEQQEAIENEAENLYGLIHARYLLTNRGLHSMYDKYRNGDFGRCPRVHCYSANLLPVGLFDIPNKDSVKLFCPNCEEIYNPKSSRHEHIDGAFFGTTFAHLFFMVFPELKPEKPAKPEAYVPRVFGFKIHRTSHEKSLEIRRKTLQQQKKPNND